MIELLQLTDLHIVSPAPADRADPLIRTIQALEHMKQRHPRAAGLILTGDLADTGDPEAYMRLKTALSDFPLPYWMLPGNHDARTPLQNIFPEALGAGSTPFLQQRIDLEGLSILALDTLEPGQSGGTFCSARAKQAEKLLADRRETPVLVALHHPPMAVRMPFMDGIRLDSAGADRLADALATHPKILHLIAGHLHRPVFARWRGYSVSTLFGPNQQLGLRMNDPGIHIADGPGCYGVLRIDPADGSLVLHQASFSDEWPERRVL